MESKKVQSKKGRKETPKTIIQAMLEEIYEKAININKEKILRDGTKEVNRNKFIQIYEQVSK